MGRIWRCGIGLQGTTGRVTARAKACKLEIRSVLQNSDLADA